MARRRFQVAPSGNTIGLYLASDADSSLAVVAYPKFWQVAPTSRKVIWPDGMNHLAIAAGELDIIELEARADRLLLLDRPVQRVGGIAESLVVPVNGRRNTLEERSSTPNVDPLSALLGVESLMRRVGSGGMLPVDSGLVAPHFREPLLRPLLYSYFIKEVEAVVRRARREYVWAEEVLPVLLGRPDPSSLLVNAATGWPRVRCRFQDFTRATPTLMSICAALELIADDGVVGSAGAVLVGDVRDEAIRLRRLLADVPSMNRTLAARAAVDARRIGGAWEWGRALEFAAGVLWPDAGLNLGEDDRAVEIAIDSSRVWELVLLAIFRSAGLEVFDLNSSAVTPFSVGRPWIGLGVQPPRPDLLVGTGDAWYVLDAKYKAVAGTPAIDDLYQMFAYSHLGSLNLQGAVAGFGLVYPTRGPLTRCDPVTHPRSPDGDVELAIYRYRYPTIRECRRDWVKYVNEQATSARLDLLTSLSSATG